MIFSDVKSINGNSVSGDCVIEKSVKGFFNGVVAAVSSYKAVAPILSLGFICWFFALPELLVWAYLSVFLFLLVFSDDVKNIFALIFYVPFFITNIGKDMRLCYPVSIGIAAVALILFFARSLILKKRGLKRGEMFVGIMFAAVAFLIGGVARFDLTVFAITAALTFATYVFYFAVLNYTEDFKTYFINLFVAGALFLSAELLILCVYEGVFDFSTNFRVWFVGAFHVNTCATYVLIGIISAFALGLGKKFDWAYILLVIPFEIILFLTYCRTMYVLSAAFIIALYVLSVIKSPNKKLLISAVVAALLLAVAVIIALWSKFVEFLDPLILKTGINSRTILWPWCWDKFLQYPIFGYGFVSEEGLPTLTEALPLVLAHNTVLQWLTSLGEVGASLITYFYLCKYKVLFRKLNVENFFFRAVAFMIALSGIVDQAPAMDYFIFIIPLLIVASVEKEKTSFSPLY